MISLFADSEQDGSGTNRREFPGPVHRHRGLFRLISLESRNREKVGNFSIFEDYERIKIFRNQIS